ncbi:MAG: polyprenyl synthetase family protein [Gammaproteobacteria bacterium]|nr:polyprenyl synthetase family protein [Gammaproteobacteria bacterium]MCH9764085.1 polyprenyl synthetase family protein [Gammaproteobacteria bacterium]
MIDNLRTLVRDDLSAVHTLITESVQSEISLLNNLIDHIMQAGGKQLRPLILLLSSHAVGYKGKNHITLAAMIELFHTATLLHDDVIDDSALRRGRKTANNIWGSKASILVGDYLLAQYMQLMIRVGNLKIMRILADMTQKIGRGEIKQLSSKNNPFLTTESYFEIIEAKTSVLFAASSRLGALVNDADDATEQALHAYGLHLGNAFQLIDDALDYSSDAETIGKNIGDDLADGKATMPVLYALQQGSPEQQSQIRQGLTQASLEFLPDILNVIKATYAIEYTKGLAEKEVQQAIACLDILPDSVYKKALADLAQYAISRSY